MVSGFNHLKITLGDDFSLGQLYHITEQIDSDIFNSDKLLYCHIVLTDTAAEGLGIKELVVMMSKAGTLYSGSIVTIIPSGMTLITMIIAKDNDGVYIVMSSSD